MNNDPSFISYIPDEDAIEWCINEQVMHFNNAEVSIMFIFTVGYLLLVANAFAREYKWKAFEGFTVSFARYAILFALILYLVFFKYRLIPLLTT